MIAKKGNLSPQYSIILALFFFIPLLILMLKLPFSPFSELMNRYFSMSGVPVSLYGRVGYILFVPLGALIVTFFRLSLGIRILGPFRSILIAVAFQITGIIQGILFLTIIIAIIVLVRPLLKQIKLPYFARVSVILSAVSVILCITILSGLWMNEHSLLKVSYFPIVVLCLTGEGFARTLTNEGLKSAAWRGVMTIIVAIIITLLSGIKDLQEILMKFPELLIAQIGMIILISEFFDHRLLQSLNPLPKKKGVKKNRLKKKK